jgi:hypothetical protein
MVLYKNVNEGYIGGLTFYLCMTHLCRVKNMLAMYLKYHRIEVHFLYEARTEAHFFYEAKNVPRSTLLHGYHTQNVPRSTLLHGYHTQNVPRSTLLHGYHTQNVNGVVISNNK